MEINYDKIFSKYSVKNNPEAINDSNNIVMPKQFFIELFNKFICAMTHQFGNKLVLAQDGFCYEEEFIAKWLKTSNISPLTNKQINSNIYDVILVTTIKNLIFEYFDKEYFDVYESEEDLMWSKNKEKIIPLFSNLQTENELLLRYNSYNAKEITSYANLIVTLPLNIFTHIIKNSIDIDSITIMNFWIRAITTQYNEISNVPEKMKLLVDYDFVVSPHLFFNYEYNIETIKKLFFEINEENIEEKTKIILHYDKFDIRFLIDFFGSKPNMLQKLPTTFFSQIYDKVYNIKTIDSPFQETENKTLLHISSFIHNLCLNDCVDENKLNTLIKLFYYYDLQINDNDKSCYTIIFDLNEINFCKTLLQRKYYVCFSALQHKLLDCITKPGLFFENLDKIINGIYDLIDKYMQEESINMYKQMIHQVLTCQTKLDVIKCFIDRLSLSNFYKILKDFFVNICSLEHLHELILTKIKDIISIQDENNEREKLFENICFELFELYELLLNDVTKSYYSTEKKQIFNRENIIKFLYKVIQISSCNKRLIPLLCDKISYYPSAIKILFDDDCSKGLEFTRIYITECINKREHEQIMNKRKKAYKALLQNMDLSRVRKNYSSDPGCCHCDNKYTGQFMEYFNKFFNLIKYIIFFSNIEKNQTNKLTLINLLSLIGTQISKFKKSFICLSCGMYCEVLLIECINMLINKLFEWNV